MKREPGTDHDSSPSNDHHPPATDQDEGALLTEGQPPAGTLTEVKNEVPSNYDEEQANVVAVSEQVDEIRITTTQLTTNGSTVSERTVTTSKRTAVVEAHRTRQEHYRTSQAIIDLVERDLAPPHRSQASRRCSPTWNSLTSTTVFSLSWRT